MLTRWEPFREVVRWFDDPLFRVWTADGAETCWTPAVDVTEDDKEFLVQADLPGVDPKDVAIDLKEDVLTIQGSRKSEKDESREGCRHVERSYGSFCRSFTLPTSVSSDKVEAEYKDGVLRIHLPKREEAKPRKIEVKAN